MASEQSAAASTAAEPREQHGVLKADVGAAVTIWLGSNPTKITITPEGNDKYMLLVEFKEG